MNVKYKKFLKEYGINKTLSLSYVAIIAIIVISAFISLMRPRYQGIIIDSLVNANSSTLGSFYKQLAIFLLLLLAFYSFKYLQNHVTQIIAEKIATKLKLDINRKINRVNKSYFCNHNYEDIQVKIDKNIEVIKQRGINSIIVLISDLLIVIVVIPYMYRINSNITVANVLLLLLVPIISKLYGDKINMVSKRILNSYSSIVSVLSDNFKNWRTTRLYGSYEYTYDRFEFRVKDYQDLIVRRDRYYNLNSFTILLIQFIGTAIIWIIGSRLVSNGNMTVGTIMALMNYQAIIMNPILNLADFYNQYHTAIESIEDIYSFYELEDVNDNGIKIFDDIESIELRNVTFGYENKKILDDISYKFEKGNIYAIVGKSGVGKSTILELLSGFRNITKGSILINGIELSEYNILDYWKIIGYLSQMAEFYNDTICNNIHIVNNNKTIIDSIANKIDIDNEIIEKENGWNTLINTSSKNLSEGQLKRLDFIRSIIKNPAILLLDEPTSGLDEKRKKQVLKLVQSYSKDRITIIVTHDEALPNALLRYVFPFPDAPFNTMWCPSGIYLQVE